MRADVRDPVDFRPSRSCGGTFKAAVERLDENGVWRLGMGAKMRLSQTVKQCQQCGRTT